MKPFVFLFYHLHRRKWWIASAVIALASYFFTPIALTAAARSLIRTDPLIPADVVIALGGDARCLRERGAAGLYHQGLAKHVIVSGVPYAWKINTGEAAQRYVVSLGIPKENIFVLRESWNTRREAIDTAELMRAKGWHSALIVTSAFHSRRALYTFERYAIGLSFYSAPLPAAPPEWQPQKWWSRRGDMGTTVREFVSWANTLVGGLK